MSDGTPAAAPLRFSHLRPHPVAHLPNRGLVPFASNREMERARAEDRCRCGRRGCRTRRPGPAPSHDENWVGGRGIQALVTQKNL